VNGIVTLFLVYKIWWSVKFSIFTSLVGQVKGGIPTLGGAFAYIEFSLGFLRIS
jgi:hypothetical protein